MKKNEEELDKKKKSNKALIIVLCIIFGGVYLFLPLLIFFGVIFVSDTFDSNYRYESEYKVVDDTVIFEDERAVIKELNGTLYNDDKYIVTGYIDNNNAMNLELVVDFYDSNNYILGQRTIILELNKNKKYKFNAVYDEFNANEVANFKISRIVCE